MLPGQSVCLSPLLNMIKRQCLVRSAPVYGGSPERSALTFEHEVTDKTRHPRVTSYKRSVDTRLAIVA